MGYEVVVIMLSVLGGAGYYFIIETQVDEEPKPRNPNYPLDGDDDEESNPR